MLSKAYFGYYFVLRRFFKCGPANWLSQDKAMIVVGSLEISMYFAIYAFLSATTSLNFPLNAYPILVVAPIAILIVIVNYRIFANSVRFQEFSSYYYDLTADKRIIWQVATASTTVLVPCVIIILFVLASQGSE